MIESGDDTGGSRAGDIDTLGSFLATYRDVAADEPFDQEAADAARKKIGSHLPGKDGESSTDGEDGDKEREFDNVVQLRPPSPPND